MKDNPFEQAQAFDRLEELVANGATPNDPEAGDLAGELAVVQLLTQDAEATPMPREDLFRSELMDKLQKQRTQQRRSFGPVRVLMAMAATFAIAFLSFRLMSPPPDEAHSHDLVVDDQQVAQAIQTLTHDDMIAYLNHTERLLMSIRDHDMACDDQNTDMALERKLARELLMRQKRFSNTLNDARYNQARTLFASLESILVDVKNLDPCTDPVDLELINDHISNKRILGKLRLIAQEIQMS